MYRNLRGRLKIQRLKDRYSGVKTWIWRGSIRVIGTWRETQRYRVLGATRIEPWERDSEI